MWGEKKRIKIVILCPSNCFGLIQAALSRLRLCGTGIKTSGFLIDPHPCPIRTFVMSLLLCILYLTKFLESVQPRLCKKQQHLLRTGYDKLLRVFFSFFSFLLLWLFCFFSFILKRVFSSKKTVKLLLAWHVQLYTIPCSYRLFLYVKNMSFILFSFLPCLLTCLCLIYFISYATVIFILKINHLYLANILQFLIPVRHWACLLQFYF